MDLRPDHVALLAGITFPGYATPGCGCGDQDEEGTPRRDKYVRQLAAELSIPGVIANAWSLSFVGADTRRAGADVRVDNMDKATGAATSGLITAHEQARVGIRCALGRPGDCWGTLASYGKAAYVTRDPGKEAGLTRVHVLKTRREHPRPSPLPSTSSTTWSAQSSGPGRAGCWRSWCSPGPTTAPAWRSATSAAGTTRRWACHFHHRLSWRSLRRRGQLRGLPGGHLTGHRRGFPLLRPAGHLPQRSGRGAGRPAGGWHQPSPAVSALPRVAGILPR